MFLSSFTNSIVKQGSIGQSIIKLASPLQIPPLLFVVVVVVVVVVEVDNLQVAQRQVIQVRICSLL